MHESNDNVGEVMRVNVTVAAGRIMNDSLTSNVKKNIKQAYVHILPLSIYYDIQQTWSFSFLMSRFFSDSLFSSKKACNG